MSATEESQLVGQRFSMATMCHKLHSHEIAHILVCAVARTPTVPFIKVEYTPQALGLIVSQCGCHATLLLAGRPRRLTFVILSTIRLSVLLRHLGPTLRLSNLLITSIAITLGRTARTDGPKAAVINMQAP